MRPTTAHLAALDRPAISEGRPDGWILTVTDRCFSRNFSDGSDADAPQAPVMGEQLFSLAKGSRK
jgi:hypothetical protein